MQIDGDKVDLGSRVWHERYGWGRVVSVQAGVCDVRFNGSASLVTFTDGGKSNGFQVLFWQPPIVIHLQKGVDYSGLREMIEALMKFKGLIV